MANTYRLTHCFQGNGGTTDDLYCNQFHFFTTTHAPADVNVTSSAGFAWGPLLAATVHGLWAFPTGGQSLGKYYHARCRGNLGVTKIYDVTGNPATSGPPIFTINDSTLLPSSDYVDEAHTDVVPLPEEVAVCLSYQAISTGGDLPRRRGRIYLGPFVSDAVDQTISATGPTRVSSILRGIILNAAANMQNEALASGFQWRVFSTMDGAAFDIVSFQVDDAFDTIRGRGGAPSVRDSVTTIT